MPILSPVAVCTAPSASLKLFMPTISAKIVLTFFIWLIIVCISSIGILSVVIVLSSFLLKSLIKLLLCVNWGTKDIISGSSVILDITCILFLNLINTCLNLLFVLVYDLGLFLNVFNTLSSSIVILSLTSYFITLPLISTILLKLISSVIITISPIDIVLVLILTLLNKISSMIGNISLALLFSNVTVFDDPGWFSSFVLFSM